jgi:hypothetical protein
MTEEDREESSQGAELWRDVIHYEGRYMVSNMGRVRSLLGRDSIVLRSRTNQSGYERITLKRFGGGKQTISIARLVAQHFLSDWDPDLTVNHINWDREDNRVANLEMMTVTENCSNRCKEDCESRFIGVTSHGPGRWRARVWTGGERLSLGTFSTEEEAARARDAYVLDNCLAHKLNFSASVPPPSHP